MHRRLLYLPVQEERIVLFEVIGCIELAAQSASLSTEQASSSPSALQLVRSGRRKASQGCCVHANSVRAQPGLLTIGCVTF
jgi:hypothetical protein